jgi:hypothetical protein
MGIIWLHLMRPHTGCTVQFSVEVMQAAFGLQAEQKELPMLKAHACNAPWTH